MRMMKNYPNVKGIWLEEDYIQDISLQHPGQLT